jgi:hypothetical protein
MRVNKENSTTYAEITNINVGFGGTAYLVAIKQGEGFDAVYLATKQFKTAKGAGRWVEKEFAI